jgi:hypothetical protein
VIRSNSSVKASNVAPVNHQHLTSVTEQAPRHTDYHQAQTPQPIVAVPQPQPIRSQPAANDINPPVRAIEPQQHQYPRQQPSQVPSSPIQQQAPVQPVQIVNQQPANQPIEGGGTATSNERPDRPMRKPRSRFHPRHRHHKPNAQKQGEQNRHALAGEDIYSSKKKDGDEE